MLEFKSLSDIQKFTAQKNDHIVNGFSRIPKYGECGLIKRISLQEHGLLCLLYEYLNTTNGSCYPRRATLLTQIKAGESSLDGYLRNLEKAGFIRRIPARKVTNKGNYDFTSSEIIIVPIEHVDDSSYHEAINRFIDVHRYVIVTYTDKGRKVIGTGKKKGDIIAVSPSKGYSNIAETPVEKPQPYIACKPAVDSDPVNTPAVPTSIDGQAASSSQSSAYSPPPSRKRPTVTEEELEQARTEFQVFREIPGILSEVDIDHEIERAVKIVVKFGYKPGYESYMREKVSKMMANQYYAVRPKEILSTLQSDYLTIWNRNNWL